MREILARVVSLIRTNIYLFVLVIIVSMYLLAVALGAISPSGPIVPISPLSPISPPAPFAAQQALETPTPTQTPAQTPTSTPTHWTSSSIEVWCDAPGVDGSPVELYFVENGEIPLVYLNLNLQLRDANGEALLQQAKLNILRAPNECEDLFMTVPYDWRELEDVEIPAGSVDEFSQLSYSPILSGTIYQADGMPWRPEEQGWYFVADETPTSLWPGEYAKVRSFEWASPTPTPTAIPTSTPTRYYQIYLPAILRSSG